MSAYARSSMFPIKKIFRTENGSNGTEPRGGRNKRTSSSKAPRSLRQKSALSRPSKHLLAPSNVLNRPAVSVARTNNRPPVTHRRPATANPKTASNEENHRSFPEASTLIVPGADSKFQDLSQLSMWTQDQPSTASIAQPTSNHDSATLTYGSRHPPFRQQSVSAATIGSRGGSTFQSQDSFQKSTSSRVSFATGPTTAASTHHSRSSRVSVGASTTRNVAIHFPGFGSRSRQVSRQNLLPPTPYHRPLLRPALRPTLRLAPSYASTLTHSSKPTGSRYSGTQSSVSGPALHQSSWGSARQSSNTSIVSSKSTSNSKSASQQDSREQVVTDSEDRVKSLVKAEIDAHLSDRLEQLDTNEALLDDKMKQFQDVARLLDERLTTANDVHSERVQELDSKKQELDKKVSKVATMLKAAEGTVARVSQLADNAVAAIGKARSDLVESALPFLKNPVAKMVERFFGDFQAKASAESLLSKEFSPTKSPPPKRSPVAKAAVAKATKTVSKSQISKKTKKSKLDASQGKRDLKHSAPKKHQEVSPTSTKQTLSSSSSSSDSKSLFSPSNKTNFKPLTLVGIRSTTADVDDDDDEGFFTAPKKKQSCVTPCDKSSQYLLDYDLSQDSSCCSSPMATKKRNAPLPPKRGRSKKPRNTYGGGGSRRHSAGVLKDDNFSFL
jgi:hypothetical protein